MADQDRLDAMRWRAFLKIASAGTNEDGDLSIGAAVIDAADLWEENGFGERTRKDLPPWIKRLVKKGYSWDKNHVAHLVDYACDIDPNAALNANPPAEAVE